MSDKFGDFKIIDRRGHGWPADEIGACRVCGSHKHFHNYGEAHMDCVGTFRTKLEKALRSLRSFDVALAEHIERTD